MDILDFLNKNPAILSIIAFPMGLLLLLGMAKLMGMGSLVKALNEHVAAEVRIEARLQDFVNEIKNLISANWDNRRYLDQKLDHFDERLNTVGVTLDTILKVLPKRKEDRSE